MTELHFDTDQLSFTDIEGIKDNDLRDVISETCFFLPVRLIVGDKDVFRVENVNTKEIRNWIELPAFSLFLDWKESLSKLSSEGTEHIFLADAGQMMIKSNGEKVTIATNFNDVVASTNYDEFYSSVIKSINHLLGHLRNKFPDVFERKELQM
jgi:hypothetical protein